MSLPNSQAIWSVNGVTSTPLAAKWSSTPECACECMASWLMNPCTSSRSWSSLIIGNVFLNASTMNSSPAGSSRCSTLQKWVVKGSFGT